MKNTSDLWFSWFYKSWEKYAPGDLVDKGLNPTQIAEGFVNDNQYSLLELSKKFDNDNYEALNQFKKLSESELHILEYFLKLIKSNRL